MPSITNQTYLLLQYLTGQALANCESTSSTNRNRTRSFSEVANEDIENTLTAFHLIKKKINSICTHNC